MKKLKKIIVSLRASDFKGANFISPDDCALCRAIKRKVKKDNVLEGVDKCYINYKEYEHEKFSLEQYESLAKLAEKKGFNKSVLKQIELHEKV